MIEEEEEEYLEECESCKVRAKDVEERRNLYPLPMNLCTACYEGTEPLPDEAMDILDKDPFARIQGFW